MAKTPYRRAFIPVVGFAPDADEHAPGVLIEGSDNLVPSLTGIGSLPSGDALSATVASNVASSSNHFSNTRDPHLFVATAGSASAATSKIYRIPMRPTVGSPIDYSSGGGGYTATEAAVWTFAQSGNSVLAAQKGTTVQRFDMDVETTTASGSFSALTQAPKARIVETVFDFAMLFNIDDTDALNVYGDAPDRWICSAAGDITNWSANIATQATSGRITDSPGDITAAKRLGSDIVVYKWDSMFLGRYVGPPLVWSFVQIPGEGLGAFGPDCVVSIGNAHLFVGTGGFYIFDGTRPRRIGDGTVNRFFANDATTSPGVPERIQGVHDLTNTRVFWWYSSSSSNIRDRFLCYNYVSNRWGFGNRTVNAPIFFSDGSVRRLGVFNDSNILLGVNVDTPTYTAGTSVAHTGFILGNEHELQALRRVIPRFRVKPITGEQKLRTANETGSVTGSSSSSQFPVAKTSTLSKGRFDVMHRARWHQLQQTYTGKFELQGWAIEWEEGPPE